MDVRNRLKNNLIRKIQRLSTEKLTEVNDLLKTIENQLHSKDKTSKLAGIWKDLGDDIFVDLTERLHRNRANDRQIS